MFFLIGCGSGGAEPTPVPVALTADVCTDGEARDTVLYIRNLDDFEWQSATVSLSKGADTYTREWASLSPERQQAAVAITDSLEFTYTYWSYHGRLIPRGDRQRNEPPLRWDEAGTKRLHNFSNLESATIEITSPHPGDWAGEINPCQ